MRYSHLLAFFVLFTVGEILTFRILYADLLPLESITLFPSSPSHTKGTTLRIHDNPPTVPFPILNTPPTYPPGLTLAAPFTPTSPPSPTPTPTHPPSPSLTYSSRPSLTSPPPISPRPSHTPPPAKKTPPAPPTSPPRTPPQSKKNTPTSTPSPAPLSRATLRSPAFIPHNLTCPTNILSLPPASFIPNITLAEIGPVGKTTPPRTTKQAQEKEAKRFKEALNRELQRKKQAQDQWPVDKEKNKCYLESDLPCLHMPNTTNNTCGPAFLIIGTPKSGTTSLYFYLVQHPQMHQALSGQFDKEVRFFSEHWNKGPNWYLDQFPPISPNDFGDGKVHMMNGEASPTYFYDPSAPARAKTLLPKAKLIVLFRDPVERAYSDKMQLIANKVRWKPNPMEDAQFEIGIFNSCMETELPKYNDSTDAFYACYNHPKLAHKIIRHHPYIMDSVYLYQIRKWLRYFPREQFLFIKGEDMYAHTEETMHRVTDFLGLCRHNWSDIVKKVHNRRKDPYAQMQLEYRKYLTNFYFNYTHQLYYELGINFDWDSAPCSGPS